MIKLVIFDLDGILLDTERFNLASKIEEAHKLGFDLKKEDVCNSFGLCAEEANKYFKEIYGEEFDYYKIKKGANYVCCTIAGEHPAEQNAGGAGAGA